MLSPAQHDKRERSHPCHYVIVRWRFVMLSATKHLDPANEILRSG